MEITVTGPRSGKPMHITDFLTYLGFVFALGTILMILHTPVDIYRESKQAKWPSVTATITQLAVRKIHQWKIGQRLAYRFRGAIYG